MAIIKCKMCGGDLEVTPGTSVAECEYCGTKQTLPKVNDEVIQNLFNRANNLRIKCEFDKAEQIYEKILQENDAEAEAHWGIVLCKYGIEYVEDPKNFQRIPTCHRTSYDAVTTDADYLAAVEHADAAQKSIYEAEARAIDEIQKNILNIVKNEKPFDVFICYKETDENGKRTVDSAIANDIYYQLTQEGMKVFYAAITLEDKLGQEYEPYIFAALNSAKVMLVIGTKPQYFSAVWVKNEWSRFLKLMKSDRSKLLIPCYKDMDAYDLPEEFAHLQAQDMSKIGFINDVVRGIKKVAVKEEPKAAVVKETVIAEGNANTVPLLKRAFMFLEDGDWNSANEYCEKVLDMDPENAQAYLGKLMAELKVKKQDDLKNQAEPFDGKNNYQKVLRFADDDLKATIVGYIDHINTRNEIARQESIYVHATTALSKAETEKEFKDAADLFASIASYKDAAAQAENCKEQAKIAHKDKIYYLAKDLMLSSVQANIENAAMLFSEISGWRDADELKAQCPALAETARNNAIYTLACHKMQGSYTWGLGQVPCEESYRAAIEEFEKIKDWKDAEEKIRLCLEKIDELNAQKLANKKREEEERIVREKRAEEERLENERRAELARKEAEIAARRYKKIVIIAMAVIFALVAFVIGLITVIIPNNRYNNALALMEAGKYAEAAMAFGSIPDYRDSREQSFALWEQVAVRETIAGGSSHTVGLKADGTVVAVGSPDSGECNVSSWNNIIAISAGYGHTVGLKADGTVVAVGYNKYGQCYVPSWRNIVAIAAGGTHTVGLKADGTVVAVGRNYYGQCDVSSWRNIVAIGGSYHTVGLKADGTVVAVGDNKDGQCDVSSWRNIVAIAAGNNHTVGLKADGTVVAVGSNSDGQCDVSAWTDIVAIATGYNYTVGLKADGTVVAVGLNNKGECNVSSWNNIIAIAAGDGHTVGLKADGTVVAVGGNSVGQCDVSSWKDIKTP